MAIDQNNTLSNATTAEELTSHPFRKYADVAMACDIGNQFSALDARPACLPELRRARTLSGLAFSQQFADNHAAGGATHHHF